jgi:hypothetical protein
VEATLRAADVVAVPTIRIVRHALPGETQAPSTPKVSESHVSAKTKEAKEEGSG